MIYRIKIFFLIPLFSLIAMTIFADQKKDLHLVNENLKKSEIEKETLDQKVKEISKRIIELKQNETHLKLDLEYHEIKSVFLEKELWALEAQNHLIQSQLKRDFPKFNKLLSVFVHKEKTPPQVILSEAQNPESIFLSSITLNAIIPKIQEQIIQFKKQLQTIEDNKKQLEKKKNLLETEHLTLEKKYAELYQNRTEKEKLHETSLNQRKAIAQQITALSQKAQNLEALIKAMQEEKLMKQRKTSLFTSSKLPHKFISPLEKSYVTEKFGEQTSFGVQSKGIKLKSDESTQVVSPYDGTILFSGPFRQYGNIVIIEHAKGYHSFLAGLEKLGVNAGDVVVQGEEIGKLSTNREKDPLLYFEIRNNNQPLDPHLMM